MKLIALQPLANHVGVGDVFDAPDHEAHVHLAVGSAKRADADTDNTADSQDDPPQPPPQSQRSRRQAPRTRASVSDAAADAGE